MQLTQTQLERWQVYRDGMVEDTEFIDQRREIERLREPNPEDARNLLKSYINGSIDNETLRREFQSKTMNEWSTFGLSGFSGAMFLNMMVNNIPDQQEVEKQLKLVLPVPASLDAAYDRLSNFMDYLTDIIDHGIVSRRKLPIGHAPFFISAWWHFQDMREWPIYYKSGRISYIDDKLYEATNNPIDDYFAFRAVFMSLMDELNLSPWETEHLSVWYRDRKDAKPEADVAILEHVAVIEDEAEDLQFDDEQETISHSQIQLLLAKIGKKLGCRVWIAANDHNRYADGERLGDYSVKDLPPYIVADPEAQKIIKLIDVLWLQGNRGVAAAFEVEHTTSIYSGLLRMSDLLTLQPNISFPLYIVTSNDRLSKVRRELARPTFQAIELHETCGFFSYEELIQEKESIMRWANSPDAIKKLAEYVPTVLDQ